MSGNVNTMTDRDNMAQAGRMTSAGVQALTDFNADQQARDDVAQFVKYADAGWPREAREWLAAFTSERTLALVKAHQASLEAMA